MQSLNKNPPKELNLPSNPHDTVEKFSCDSNNQVFINWECDNCKLPEKIAESRAFETDDIKFDEWRQKDVKRFMFLLMLKKSLHALMHTSGH